MFQSRKKKSFWSQLFDTERENRFTIEELGFLHEVLDSNARVHQGNKDTVVEALRSIAELMIWGDQHDASFFEFFAEHQTLSYFHRILSQKYCRSGEVAVQILQTLSILTQNIQSEQAIYFLFSNNHVNQIIMQDFNFADDEVLGYYISFLKTISLKLNSGTVQFFFQKKRRKKNSASQQNQPAGSAGEGGGSSTFHGDFPFYSRITQFFRHEESMVRAAVRTCTLNIYSVKDPDVRAFLTSSTEASNYLVNLGKYVMEQCQALAVILPATKQGTIDPKRLDVALEELDDIFYYCHDIYCLVSEGIGEKLMCVLWKDLYTILLEPFKTNQNQDKRARVSRLSHDSSILNSSRLTVSLLILERLFHILQIPGLLNALFASMFLPKAKALQMAPLLWSTEFFDEDSAGEEEDGAGSPKREFWYDAWPVFQGCIASEEMHIESTLCVRFLIKCIKCKCLDEDLMDAAGLLPGKKKTSRMLFNELTSLDSIGSDPSSETNAPMEKGHRRTHSSEEIATMQLFPHDDSTNANGEVADPGSTAGNLEKLSLDDGGVGDKEKGQAAPYLVFADLISIEPCRVELVNLVGWMISQMLPLDNSARKEPENVSNDEENRDQVFSPRKNFKCRRAIPGVLADVLKNKIKECASLLRIHLQHTWCDGILLLISKAWQRNKRHLISPQVSMNAVETSKFLLQNHSSSSRRSANSDQKSSIGISTAVVAAQQANDAVNAFVAVAQLKVWLESGDLPDNPSSLFALDRILLDEPVGLIAHDTRPLPVTDGSEVDISSLNLLWQSDEARDQNRVISKGALSCRVAFTRGAERNVFFCLDGRHALSNSQHENGKRILGSVCIFLADANESVASANGRFAKVVAMAPLAGAEPAIDPTHPSWLHLRVRPPLSALLAVCTMLNNNVMQGKRPKLNDGRWTLAFEDAASAKMAQKMVEGQRKQLRANSDELFSQFNV